LSAKIVVTAAHCIQNKEETIAKVTREAALHLGRYDINVPVESGAMRSDVEAFIMHPDWNPRERVYVADIAVAVLRRVIDFSLLIRPICLWTSTRSYEDLINQRGTIAGWGKTEHGELSSQPFYAEIGIVSEVDCLRSNVGFYKVTSATGGAFCAGGTKSGSNSNACMGDSGTGLIVKSSNRYYLRGVVSAGSPNADGQCDLSNFVLFTDTAKFTDWVKNYIDFYG